MKESFSGVERENEELRGQLASGAMILEIDPTLVDPSPIADRFDETSDVGFEALKASIGQRGQEVPILVREHPSGDGRYQSAYGHRRVKAARELGIPVKAIVRSLTDEDLVVAQGVENSARQDLSFIERAVFAMRLEDAGHERSVVQEALSIDRAEASKLLSVVRAVPADLVSAIGRAPKVGRGRWQALADTLKSSPSAVKAARAAIKKSDFRSRDSDARFLSVLSAITSTLRQKPPSKRDTQAVVAVSGEALALVSQGGRDLKISFDQALDAAFASFLIEQLPALFEAYKATSGKGGTGEA
jgi:ParB family chromosome partitioning protein